MTLFFDVKCECSVHWSSIQQCSVCGCQRLTHSMRNRWPRLFNQRTTYSNTGAYFKYNVAYVLIDQWSKPLCSWSGFLFLTVRLRLFHCLQRRLVPHCRRRHKTPEWVSKLRTAAAASGAMLAADLLQPR